MQIILPGRLLINIFRWVKSYERCDIMKNRKFYFKFVILLKDTIGVETKQYECCCENEKLKYAQAKAIHSLISVLHVKHLTIDDVIILSFDLINVEKEVS